MTLTARFVNHRQKPQQQQQTNNNKQTTNNNKQQQTTTNNKQQTTTNNQQPTTNNQQPTTNNQQPTTNNQQPTTLNRNRDSHWKSGLLYLCPRFVQSLWVWVLPVEYVLLGSTVDTYSAGGFGRFFVYFLHCGEFESSGVCSPFS